MFEFYKNLPLAHPRHAVYCGKVHLIKAFPHTKKSLLSTFVMMVTGMTSKMFMFFFQNPSFYIEDGDTLRKMSSINVQKDFNIQNSPIISYSNHKSTLDDPLMWSFLPISAFQSRKVRWVPATHDICFTNTIFRCFFSFGQCIPIIRGQGIKQPGMKHLDSILESNQWVHIFPEGFVQPEKGPIAPFRWGIGELFLNRKEKGNIVLLPIYIHGMDNIKGLNTYGVNFFQDVSIVVGKPLKISNSQHETKSKSRSIVTEIMRENLLLLQKKTNKFLIH
jgi:monolysocardiolipin acyltransferase